MAEVAAVSKPTESKVIKLLILSDYTTDNKDGMTKKVSTKSNKSKVNPAESKVNVNRNKSKQADNSNKTDEKNEQHSKKDKKRAKKIKLDKCDSEIEESRKDEIQNNLNGVLENILYSKQMNFFKTPEVIEILQNMTDRAYDNQNLKF